jgi:transposase
LPNGWARSPPQVSKWRQRFRLGGVDNLQDRPRPGRPVRYSAQVRLRILAALDGPPPAGHSRWNGRLLAERLGDISCAQVWRVLRAERIHLERRRQWCVSTDPEFAPKAAGIIGLYLAPPENAVLLCVDEKPHIQALERAQGWLRLPDGTSMMGIHDRDRRHGPPTLFAALEVATGQVKVGQFRRRRRRELLDFMNEVVRDFPDRDLHVIVDNRNTHKPKHDRWLARHPRVRFHFTATNPCWLNQIEVWFSILTRATLAGGSFTPPRRLRQAIDEFLTVYNAGAAPFEWRKQVVHPKPLEDKYSNLRN